MQFWQIALVVLALVWALQAFGTFIQMRHYRDVMGAISQQWSDGHLGAGNARGTIGKGVIIVLVVSPDERVRKLLVMEGRSVFAKFKSLPEFQGRALAELRQGHCFGEGQAGRERAFNQAIEQIDRARRAVVNEVAGSQPVSA